ncbi:MAG: serine/threonine protein kinase [Myxococcaceae bacterium]|nr:serine/threonine protein kinase [Myxococcaceae bacterium]
MSTKTETPAPLTFDRFWRWLLDHPNCVIRAGSDDCTLIDHEDFHWDFLEEEEGDVVIQLVKGKALVAELILARRDVLFVQASLDVENASSGYWLFELIGGPKEETFTVAHVLMSHGIEQQQGHQLLKH